MKFIWQDVRLSLRVLAKLLGDRLHPLGEDEHGPKSALSVSPLILLREK